MEDACSYGNLKLSLGNMLKFRASKMAENVSKV